MTATWMNVGFGIGVIIFLAIFMYCFKQARRGKFEIPAS